MKLHLRHLYEIDLEGFWRMFFDREYTRRLYEEGLAFSRCQELELKRSDNGEITRKLRIEPKFEAPAVVAKILGDRFYYVESGRFDPAQKRWTYSLTPSVLADKVLLSGSIWAEPRGPGSIDRLAEIDISVRVLGVGGILEGFIEKQNKDGYLKAADFSNRWVKEPRP